MYLYWKSKHPKTHKVYIEGNTFFFNFINTITLVVSFSSGIFKNYFKMVQQIREWYDLWKAL